MLGGKLAARTGGHPDDDRDGELSVGHMPHRRGGIHDLIQREQAEVHRHHFDDGPQSVECGTHADADEAEFRDGGIADALGPELLEHPLGHRIGSAVPADILAE